MGKCICYQLLLDYSVDLRHPATGISLVTMVSKILKELRVVKKGERHHCQIYVVSKKTYHLF